MARNAIQPLTRDDSAGFKPNLLYLCQLDNDLRQYRKGAYNVFASGTGYRGMTPANLTSNKGLNITNSDNYQYSRGSRTDNAESVVYENFDLHQGTLEFWVRPNWDGGDGEAYMFFDIAVSGTKNRIAFYKKSANDNIALLIRDKDNDSHIVEYDISSAWTAGDWYHIIATWDFNADSMVLYEAGMQRDNTPDAALSSDSINAFPVNFNIGQSYTQSSQLNGIIAGRILNRPLTSTEVTALYNGGDGHTDTFTVTPDTVWMGTYSDNSTDVIFQHRGQLVVTTTEDDVTVAESIGNRSWTNGDRVVIYDGTGYKKETTIDDVPSGTNIPVTNTADLNKVGVSLDFNAAYNAVAANNGIHDITTEDIGISAWIRMDTGIQASTTYILQKRLNAAGSGYQLNMTSGDSCVLALFMIDAENDVFTMSGNTALNDNKWHHIAVIMDRSNLANCKIYLDGYEDGTTNKDNAAALAAADESLTNTGIFTLGSRTDDSNYFDGQIRDVILAYPVDIMAAGEMGASGEILTLATGTRDLSTVNSEDYWTCNDDAADTVVTGNNINLIASANTNTFSTQSAFISRNLIPDSGMENGGIGAITSINAANIAKDTSIIKFDTRSKKITAAASPGYTHLSITVAANENYFFSGWEKGSATGHKTKFLIYDNDGAADIIDEEYQDHSSDWFNWETAFKVPGGCTDLGIYMPVEFDTEIGYWDNIQLLPNLVNNGGCEIDDTGLAITNNETAGSDVVIEMVDTGDLAVGDLIYFNGAGGGTTEWVTIKVFTLDTSITVDITTNKSAGDEVSGYAWNTAGTPTSGEVVFSTNAKHSGTLGLELVNADDGEGLTQDITVVSGKYYTLSAWAKNDSQDTEVLLSDATTKTIDTTNSNAWEKYSYTFKAVSTTLTIKLVSGATDQNGYFDDISVIEVDRVGISSAVPSTSANSYNIGKWSDADGAFVNDGGDTTYFPCSDNIQNDKGSLSIWTYWQLPYNSYSSDKYIWEVEDVFRCYYNKTDYKFYFEVYNGADWTTVRCVSSAQSFTAGTWKHICCTWDNTSGTYLYVEGSVDGDDASTWSVQSLPTNVYIGSSYDATKQQDGRLDDIRVYDDRLDSVEVSNLYSTDMN